ETLEQWSRYLVSQAAFDARSHRAFERLQQQLALPGAKGDRNLLDLVIGDVAITGSDLFIQEGSDITLLLKLKQPKLFQARLETAKQKFLKDNPDVRKVEGKWRDVDFVFLSNGDRTVHVFAANPLPDLHVRSNSRPALERVLEAIRGKKADKTPIQRLA